MKITKKQFIKNYCKKSNITYEKIKSLGMRARPCYCNYEGCKGWQMIHDTNYKFLKDFDDYNPTIQNLEKETIKN